MATAGLAKTGHDVAVRGAMHSIRAFTDAMDRMHNGMKRDMDMNGSDLAALRMIIMREQRDEPVRPHDVARHLRISTASTTKLLDRLTHSGHVERRPHPHDRRARIIVLTDASRRMFYTHFGERLAAMRGVAARYSDEELAVIVRFLDDLTEAVAPE
jgi:DNA-binding MarR family transcriptional regulator